MRKLLVVSNVFVVISILALRVVARENITEFSGIQSVNNPLFVSVEKATIKDESPIIGLNLDGEKRAYSLNLLVGREVVNDSFGGNKFAVVW